MRSASAYADGIAFDATTNHLGVICLDDTDSTQHGDKNLILVLRRLHTFPAASPQVLAELAVKGE